MISSKKTSIPIVLSCTSPSLVAAFTPTASDLWTIRIASALTTYFGFVSVTDRPRGIIAVDTDTCLEVKQSSVPGAGLGLFAKTSLEKGTVLGTYPGVLVPLEQNLGKLQQYPQCEGYIWRFGDNKFVLDPTNAKGNCDFTCQGGNPSMPLSKELFQFILPFWQVSTILCRINEPPIGSGVNVVTEEDLDKRIVVFIVERNIFAGEELFIDYGLSYDRSNYGGAK